MTDYPTGTVARATVRGVPDVTVMRGGRGNAPVHDWLSSAPIEHRFGHPCSLVTDIRPLVVLDLDYIRFENFGLPAVLATLRSTRSTQPIADQIEAQTKPPRIPEPSMFAIVGAMLGGGGATWRFVRSDYGWVCLEDGTCHVWESLNKPTLIRPGIEDAQ